MTRSAWVVLAFLATASTASAATDSFSEKGFVDVGALNQV
jgi:hypothetical protein